MPGRKSLSSGLSLPSGKSSDVDVWSHSQGDRRLKDRPQGREGKEEQPWGMSGGPRGGFPDPPRPGAGSALFAPNEETEAQEAGGSTGVCSRQ